MFLFSISIDISRDFSSTRASCCSRYLLTASFQCKGESHIVKILMDPMPMIILRKLNLHLAQDFLGFSHVLQVLFDLLLPSKQLPLEVTNLHFSVFKKKSMSSHQGFEFHGGTTQLLCCLQLHVCPGWVRFSSDRLGRPSYACPDLIFVTKARHKKCFFLLAVQRGGGLSQSKQSNQTMAKSALCPFQFSRWFIRICN